jgi:hypothetical protein
MEPFTNEIAVSRITGQSIPLIKTFNERASELLRLLYQQFHKANTGKHDKMASLVRYWELLSMSNDNTTWLRKVAYSSEKAPAAISPREPLAATPTTN